MFNSMEVVRTRMKDSGISGANVYFRENLRELSNKCNTDNASLNSDSVSMSFIREVEKRETKWFILNNKLQIIRIRLHISI